MKGGVTEIVMEENYMETLRRIPVGVICIYKVKHCDVYQGFKMAKSRMKKQGAEFTLVLLDHKKAIKVTRTQ